MNIFIHWTFFSLWSKLLIIFLKKKKPTQLNWNQLAELAESLCPAVPEKTSELSFSGQCLWMAGGGGRRGVCPGPGLGLGGPLWLLGWQWAPRGLCPGTLASGGSWQKTCQAEWGWRLTKQLSDYLPHFYCIIAEFVLRYALFGYFFVCHTKS